MLDAPPKPATAASPLTRRGQAPAPPAQKPHNTSAPHTATPHRTLPAQRPPALGFSPSPPPTPLPSFIASPEKNNDGPPHQRTNSGIRGATLAATGLSHPSEPKPSTSTRPLSAPPANKGRLNSPDAGPVPAVTVNTLFSHLLKKPAAPETNKNDPVSVAALTAITLLAILWTVDTCTSCETKLSEKIWKSSAYIAIAAILATLTLCCPGLPRQIARSAASLAHKRRTTQSMSVQPEPPNPTRQTLRRKLASNPDSKEPGPSFLDFSPSSEKEPTPKARSASTAPPRTAHPQTPTRSSHLVAPPVAAPPTTWEEQTPPLTAPPKPGTPPVEFSPQTTGRGETEQNPLSPVSRLIKEAMAAQAGSSAGRAIHAATDGDLSGSPLPDDLMVTATLSSPQVHPEKRQLARRVIHRPSGWSLLGNPSAEELTAKATLATLSPPSEPMKRGERAGGAIHTATDPDLSSSPLPDDLMATATLSQPQAQTTRGRQRGRLLRRPTESNGTSHSPSLDATSAAQAAPSSGRRGLALKLPIPGSRALSSTPPITDRTASPSEPPQNSRSQARLSRPTPVTATTSDHAPGETSVLPLGPNEWQASKGSPSPMLPHALAYCRTTPRRIPAPTTGTPGTINRGRLGLSSLSRRANVTGTGDTPQTLSPPSTYPFHTMGTREPEQGKPLERTHPTSTHVPVERPQPSGSIERGLPPRDTSAIVHRDAWSGPAVADGALAPLTSPVPMAQLQPTPAPKPAAVTAPPPSPTPLFTFSPRPPQQNPPATASTHTPAASSRTMTLEDFSPTSDA